MAYYALDRAAQERLFAATGTHADTAATPNHVHGLPDAALGAYQTTPNAGDNHPPPYLM